MGYVGKTLVDLFSMCFHYQALKSIDLDFIDYDFEQFYTASSKEDLCNANSTSDGKPV